MAKYTPGPWNIGYGRASVSQRTEESQLITELGPIGIDHNHWEGPYFNVSDSDARLIAAAPEMADALIGLLDCCELNMDDMEPETHKAIELAHAVLQKAQVRS